MSSQTQRLAFAAAAFTVLYAMGLITKTSVAIAGLTALCAVLFAALPPNALEMHHFHSPSPALLKWKTMGRYLIHQPAASSDPEELAGPFNVFTVDLTCPKESCRNTGRTLVIAHGFPTSSFDFAHMIDRLWEKFDRVVIPDFLGFGFSDKPLRFTYSFHKQADLVLDVIRQLGVARAHFLAHDYGVSVLQEITARVYDGSVPSDLVQSASYLNGGVVANSPLLIQTLLSHDIVGPILSKVTCYPLFRRNFKRIFGPDTQPSETEIRDFWSLVTLQNGHKLNHRILKYLDDRKQHQARWTAALRTESPAGHPRAVPYVAINGPADPVSGRHVMERLKELVPNAQIRFLTDNIGHYPQLEAPDQVLRFFFEFIDGVSSGQQ